MGKHAFIVGGTGQIGWAIARDLLLAGWSVTVSHRGLRQLPNARESDLRFLTLDREIPGALAAALADGADAIIDTVAFDAKHADQLLEVQENVGSIMVISSTSVYCDDHGRSLDEAVDATDFPNLPIPIPETQRTVNPGPRTYSTRKVALERRLTDNASVPVTILRPGAVHGVGSLHPREWWFVKRFLDGRRAVPLKYRGESRFSTTSVRNLSALALKTLEALNTHILNVVDPDVPTVAEIGTIIANHMGISCQIIGLESAVAEWSVGESPWSTALPFVASDAAARELGYSPVEEYRQALPSMCDWLISQASEGDWRERFPVMAKYPWNPFDYEAEDIAISAMRTLHGS